MQRADGANRELLRLFKQRLHLYAVLAHNVQVISARLSCPVRIRVTQEFFHRAKTAKSVCREKNLLAALIAHHDLWPVNHRRHEEGKRVAAERQCISLSNNYPAGCRHCVRAEELLKECKGFCIAYKLHVRVFFHQNRHICRVIRLHVGDNEIVRRSAAKAGFQIFQPGFRSTRVHRVHHGNLFIQNQVGIIADACRHRILALKKIQLGIVKADGQDCITHSFKIHFAFSPRLLYTHGTVQCIRLRTGK